MWADFEVRPDVFIIRNEFVRPISCEINSFFDIPATDYSLQKGRKEGKNGFEGRPGAMKVCDAPFSKGGAVRERPRTGMLSCGGGGGL